MSRVPLWTLLGLLLVATAAAPAAAEPAYILYPDIHGDHIVFCAESDLWTVDVSGGAPQRLTTHPGTEYFPAYSPDGTLIAFTGEYDGVRDVFVIPAAGGEPRRLTGHPSNDEVVGWMPDGRRVIFRSSRRSPLAVRLYTVDIDGGDPQELPLGWAVRLDVDPVSGRWAFNRKSRERATWKRYRGGTASDIWVGDPKKADFRQVTDFPGMDHFPMWHDGRIYFLSDQGGTANIWSILPDGTDRKRHTTFDKWDANWPSMGPDGRIVFTLAADVHLFDPATGKERRIDIDLPSDRTLTRTRYPDAAQNLTGFDLSPDGDRLALVARGEIFSVPVEKGVTLTLTRGSGSREKDAMFGPKGETLLYLTDETGEDQFRTMDAWGRGKPRVVEDFDGGWRLSPELSPDGKTIAWGDNDYRLWIMPVEGGKPVEVDRGTEGEIQSYAWSPDGRWLAYGKTLPNGYDSIFIYDTQDKVSRPVSGRFTSDRSPAWDPDGRFLYYVSDRAINPVLGTVDWNNVEIKNDQLYMILLREDVKNPLIHVAGLPPEDEKKDEADKKDDEKDEKKDDEKEGEEAPAPVGIDFDGILDRTVELPVDRGGYYGLAATKGRLFYVSAPVQGMAEQPGLFQDSGPINSLMSFDLDKEEADTFVDGIIAYDLAPKADKVAVLKGPGELYVVGAAAAPGAGLSEGKVDLSDMVVELDPRQEWRQIYFEAWRQMRAYYWDKDMSGVDWKGKRDQYATLLPRLSSRADLSDLMGQLFGEMNTSHTYVFGGDPGVHVTRVSTGMLGADLVRNGDAFEVTRIYRGDPADRVVSPLAAPGVGVKEGDFILAVDGRSCDDGAPLYTYFEKKAGKEVLLKVNDGPRAEGAREVLVTPLSGEHDLRYADWVRRNREYVAEKTGGKIGYIHIPDMWTDGLVEFNTWFYPQLDLEGMIVDVRWNGGGAVSQQLVERLSRHLLSMDLSRGGGKSTYPYRVLNGPFVVLTNEFAGSDGDIFPQAVQLAGLAPVIGMRSWGGVVGIASMRPLVDGGLVTVSQSAWWDARDGWGLENRGVIPDIEVQDMPQDLARGVDAQLDRGIQEVMRLHAEHPPVKPDFPPVRNRDRSGFKDELR